MRFLRKKKAESYDVNVNFTQKELFRLSRLEVKSRQILRKKHSLTSMKGVCKLISDTQGSSKRVIRKFYYSFYSELSERAKHDLNSHMKKTMGHQSFLEFTLTSDEKINFDSCKEQEKISKQTILDVITKERFGNMIAY